MVGIYWRSGTESTRLPFLLIELYEEIYGPQVSTSGVQGGDDP